MSTVKLQISERVEKEEAQNFKDKHAEANPDAEPLTDPLSDADQAKV